MSKLFFRIQNRDLPPELGELDLFHSDPSGQRSFLRRLDMFSFDISQNDRMAISRHGGFWSDHTLGFLDFNVEFVIFGEAGESVEDVNTRVKRAIYGGSERLRILADFDWHGGPDINFENLRFMDVRPLECKISLSGSSTAVRPCLDVTVRFRAVDGFWQSWLDKSLDMLVYGATVARGEDYSDTAGEDYGTGQGVDYGGRPEGWFPSSDGSMPVSPSIGFDLPSTADTTDTSLRIVFDAGSAAVERQGIIFSNIPHGRSEFDPVRRSYRAGSTNLLQNWLGDLTGSRASVPVLYPGPNTVILESFGSGDLTGLKVHMRWKDRWI